MYKTSSFIILTAVSILIAALYWTCNNPVSPAILAGITKDYMPEIKNKQMDVIYSGAATQYDTSGNVEYQTQVVDTQSVCYFGGDTTVNFISGIPIYTYDYSHRPMFACMYKYNSGELWGIDKKTNIMIKILPAGLILNKEWDNHINASEAGTIHFKVADKLNNYVNAEGNSYNDVIDLQVSYEESTSSLYDGYSYSLYSYDSTSYVYNIYLAKNIGPVGAKLYELRLSYQIITDTTSKARRYSGYDNSTFKGDIIIKMH